jgi:hypothetical protein
MVCPQIYLGPDRFTTPLDPDYFNIAIQLSDEPIVVDQAVLITVFVSNHGDQSPPTSLELYWTDPTTGFIANPWQLIGEVDFPAIPPASVLPPADGVVSVNFSWTPGRDVPDTNGGYICLLARLSNLTSPGCECTQQMYDSAHPATDPLSAVYNVQIVVTAPDPGDSRDSGDLGDPSDPRESRELIRSPMYFAFAATNTLGLEETLLDVRVLDPKQDRAKLAALVARPSIDRTLSRRNLRFGVPNGVQVGEGREGVIVTPSSVYHAADQKRAVLRPASVPRISRLGVIDPKHVPRLLLPRTRFLEAKDGGIAMNLLKGEQRQTFVRVEPGKNENEVYAVEVSHKGVDGQAIGGLILLFVPPHRYF